MVAQRRTLLPWAPHTTSPTSSAQITPRGATLLIHHHRMKITQPKSAFLLFESAVFSSKTVDGSLDDGWLLGHFPHCARPCRTAARATRASTSLQPSSTSPFPPTSATRFFLLLRRRRQLLTSAREHRTKPVRLPRPIITACTARLRYTCLSSMDGGHLPHRSPAPWTLCLLHPPSPRQIRRQRMTRSCTLAAKGL